MHVFLYMCVLLIIFGVRMAQNQIVLFFEWRNKLCSIITAAISFKVCIIVLHCAFIFLNNLCLCLLPSILFMLSGVSISSLRGFTYFAHEDLYYF